jgi:HEAT repeat protein
MPLVRKPGGQPPSATAASGVVTAEKLGSGNADERWAAARAATTEDVDALAAAVRLEKEARVREAIFTSLARLGTSNSAERLIELLRSDDATLRTGALDALRIVVLHMRDLLPRLLGDADADIRILSCELARGFPGPEATTVLCALLARETEVNVSAAAVDVLTEVGGPAAVPVLVACEQRFAHEPFLGFAIKVAIDRISAQSAEPRG